MSTPFSRRPDAVAVVRSFLISVRDRQDDLLPRYGEVAAVYGGIARAVAPVLNSVARDCAVAGEPDLSVLVVLADTALPGRLNGAVLDPQDPTARTAWQAELQHPPVPLAASASVIVRRRGGASLLPPVRLKNRLHD